MTLILRHTGGHPEAFDAVVDLCREPPNVKVDTSGDYYDNGLIDQLADAIGIASILFGSGIDWIDPRCMLGMIWRAAAATARRRGSSARMPSRCSDDHGRAPRRP